MKDKIIDKLMIVLAIADILMFWIGLLIIGICIIFS